MNKALPLRFRGILSYKYSLLILLWIVLTLFNINKAFHIDDTFHLEAAQWIQSNPLTPMSGLINWENDPTPMYTHNQPPLFFGLIALASGIFGNNEIPLHLLISIFTFFGLFYFIKISELLKLKNVNSLLILFALSPVLTVNQNLMTDVPVLSLILGSAYYLLKAKYSYKLLNYSLSALLLAIGLLIKYSLLPLVVVIILVIVLRHDYKKLIVLAIPILLISLWSVWNYFEYGSIHILDRPKSVHITKLWAFMGCLGSISVYSISLFYVLSPSRIIKRTIFFILSILLGSIVLFITNLFAEKEFAKFLNMAFILNGFFVSTILTVDLFGRLKKIGFNSFVQSDRFTIFLYICSLSLFLIILSPFIATRHILLVLPFILIYASSMLNKASSRINKLVISLSVLLGLLLGVSDWVYADYYRKMAANIELPKEKDVWSAGHWGWQWYSKANGMKQYHTNQSPVKDEDYLVSPGDISCTKINDNINLTVVDKIWLEANLLTFFSGNNFASLYSSHFNKPPWTLSKSPIDTIFVYSIEVLGTDKSSNAPK
jgi:hypothetical protein